MGTHNRSEMAAVLGTLCAILSRRSNQFGITRHLPLGTEENHNKCQSDQPVSALIYESETSRLQSRMLTTRSRYCHLIALLNLHLKFLMPLCNTSSGPCTAKKVKLLQVQELYPSRGATTLTWWEGLRASVILKAMPTGASAPDRGTHVGKAEGESRQKAAAGMSGC
jgi:hypothetical protein